MKPEQERRDIQKCIDIFLQDKKNQVVTEKVIGKYTRELALDGAVRSAVMSYTQQPL